MNIKLAADENGKLLALWGNNYVDHGPYSEFGDLLTMRLSQFTGAGYGINSIRNKSTTVFTNHAWGSAFRAYGSPQSYMGSEIAIDVLAAKMGIDPFDTYLILPSEAAFFSATRFLAASYSGRAVLNSSSSQYTSGG